jgi:glutamyl-tRNA synthetase
MSQQVRVRFAPSPTGYLHVGGLRTALYNYLFAKHNGGTFVLRIEDTDQSRKVEGAVENLIASLRWAGVDYDEGVDRDGGYGPYVQSQRLPIYHKHVDELLEQGKAYYCFCSPERLDDVRKKMQAAKLPPMYDRKCRDITLAEARARKANGENSVVRMKIPLTGEMTFDDLIRGKVSIAYKVLDDQVLLKSDGYPTYHLAVVVDDHMMGITHVVRGEEWLPSTPKHILLYNHFGWELPIYAHLPLLLNPDKSKLSKRQGDVAVEDYRAKGYLPEAIINFVAFLGWNPGDEREIFSKDDLIKEFSLERVGKAGAVFNIDKLNWLNAQHIRLKSDDELADAVMPMLAQKSISPERAYLKSAINLMKERVTTLHDFVEFSDYLYADPLTYDEKGRAKYWQPETKELMVALADKFATLPIFTHDSIEAAVRAFAEEKSVNASALIHPTRLAVSGKVVGPGLFELLHLLGKDTVVRRLRKATETM